MTMRPVFVAAACLLAAAGCDWFQHEPRVRFAEDLGPDQLEYDALVRYPEPVQNDYVVFAKRCSKCHTTARPLNSIYASPEMWSRYVTKMWRKTGSGISHQDAKQILEFLVYDSKIRKLDHRAEFEAHRRDLLEAFRARDPQAYRDLYAGREADAVSPR